MARLNVSRSASARPHTHEGAPAHRINATQQLRRLALSCLLWEDSFYIDGKTIADQISAAVNVVPLDVAAKVAIEARSSFHLRHVPLLIVREMARRGGSIVSDTLSQVIQRPDELGEFFAIYWQEQAKRSKRNHGKGDPLSAQIKKGLAKALAKFDQYQLAKYANTEDIRLRDVMFLTHPHPDKKMESVFKQLANRKLSAQDAKSKYADDDAGTWETQLSEGKDKQAVWTRLLETGQLGYLALLRNLRNMLSVQVNTDLITAAIIARKGAQRVLPFRYVAAAHAAPQLEPAIDTALCEAIAEMASLSGKTIVLVDVSGSMDAKLSAKSDLSRVDAAATLASIVPGDVRVFTFSGRTVEVPPRRGMAGIDAVLKSQPHSSTYLGAAIHRVNSLKHDRLICITDEQSHDTVPDPVAKHAYLINVGSYQNGVGYGQHWCHIDGFSEAVLRFIVEYESEG